MPEKKYVRNTNTWSVSKQQGSVLKKIKVWQVLLGIIAAASASGYALVHFLT